MTACLTKNDALELSAGGGLDAVVAERVMGWTDVWFCRHAQQYHGRPTPDNNDTNYQVPAYSTDIAAAWQLVDRLEMLCDKGRTETSPSSLVLRKRGDLYAVGHYYGSDIATGETAPLAICRAAISSCWNASPASVAAHTPAES